MEMRAYLANLIKAQLSGTIPENLPDEIALGEVVRYAQINHMDYLIAGALVRTETPNEEEKNALRGMVMKSIMRTGAQISDLKQIEKRFEENKVKNQPLKGAIMKYVYPSPEMREMSDLDILVDEKDMETAGKILEDMGYQVPKAIRHHDVYKKAPFMVVELHRSIYDESIDDKQYKYFKSFSRAQLRSGMEYTYDFGLEDFYVYMMAHMAKHFYAKGCGIRNLVDVYVYLSKYDGQMNRTYVEKELKECGILSFTKHMENLAFMWLDNQKFDAFYEELFEYMLNCGIYGKDENGIWNCFAQDANEGNSSIGLKRWFLFPPLSYMKEHYSWLEKAPILLPWAWVLRGFRGMFFRKGGAKKCELVQEVDQETIRSRKQIYKEMDLNFKKRDE